MPTDVGASQKSRMRHGVIEGLAGGRNQQRRRRVANREENGCGSNKRSLLSHVGSGKNRWGDATRCGAIGETEGGGDFFQTAKLREAVATPVSANGPIEWAHFPAASPACSSPITLSIKISIAVLFSISIPVLLSTSIALLVFSFAAPQLIPNPTLSKSISDSILYPGPALKFDREFLTTPNNFGRINYTSQLTHRRGRAPVVSRIGFGQRRSPIILNSEGLLTSQKGLDPANWYKKIDALNCGDKNQYKDNNDNKCLPGLLYETSTKSDTPLPYHSTTMTPKQN
ncbi:hypothetical protein EVAR_37865_1 [Eumeta japonica]|uniref:Uncharacterized protein n=1 Tax=Eumeta variegata TaxID=151549 RepID=A0A4C1X083_EUMVA|nr:hypothetical protein EVAR_37865_1 [Eumeta japonica]